MRHSLISCLVVLGASLTPALAVPATSLDRGMARARSALATTPMRFSATRDLPRLSVPPSMSHRNARLTPGATTSLDVWMPRAVIATRDGSRAMENEATSLSSKAAISFPSPLRVERDEAG